MKCDLLFFIVTLLKLTPIMSLNKISPLIIFLLILTNCEKNIKSEINQINTPLIDSLNLYFDLSKIKSTDKLKRLEYIDKSYNFATDLQIDTLLLKSLSYKTTLHSSNKQYDSAIHFSRRMLEISKRLNDTTNIGKSYYKLGLYHNKIKKNDSSYFNYNLSRENYLSINDSLEVGKLLLNMAIIHTDVGDYLGSEKGNFNNQNKALQG